MLVIAELDDRRFAFPSQFVDRVTWAMYITPIPGQPANFKGVIRIEDDIIPVIDLRYMAGLPEKELELSHDFVIIRSATNCFALVADRIEEVLDCDLSELVSTEDKLASYACEVVRTSGGLIVVLDPNKLVLEEEYTTLRNLIKSVTVQ